MTTIIGKKDEKDKIRNLIKKNYTSYSKLSEVKLITIGLASPELIKQWSEKMLPNGKILGEVMNANTLHHKTFKPQKGGLFCERIFGPLKDFECACGKPMKLLQKKDDKLINAKQDLTKNGDKSSNVKKINHEIDSPYQKSKKIINLNKSILGQTDLVSDSDQSGTSTNRSRNFCNICEVEYTWSVVRRYQLGYIKLISPVTHVWYLKGNPSYLSILLDIKKRHLEYITYCSETLTLENVLKGGMLTSKSSDIVSSWKKLKLKIKSQQENIFNNKLISDTKFIKENTKFNNLSSNKTKQSLFISNKFQYMSYSNIYDLLNKTKKKLSEETKSITYFNNTLHEGSDEFNRFDSSRRDESNCFDSSRNNHFLRKFLSISNLYTTKNKGLSKLTSTITNVQKLKKRNNLKLKNFESWKNLLNPNKDNLYSDKISSISPFRDESMIQGLPQTKKSLDKDIYKKVLTIYKQVINYTYSDLDNNQLYVKDFRARPSSQIENIVNKKFYKLFSSSLRHLSSSYKKTYFEQKSNSFTDSKSYFSKCLIKYSKKLYRPLKNLKYLSFLILESKHSSKIYNLKKDNFNLSLNNISEKFKYNFKVENKVLESNSKKRLLSGKQRMSSDQQQGHLQTFPIKNILKKISVSSYILLNVYISSQRKINKNLISLACEKIYHEAYIKALVRSNQILNRVNYSGAAHDKKFALFITKNLVHKQKTKVENNLHSRTPLLDKEDLSAINSSSQSLDFLFKEIKKNLYNLLDSYLPKIFNKKFSYLIIDNAANHSLKVNKLLQQLCPSGSGKNELELYTLSSLPCSFSNLLISTFLVEEIFTVCLPCEARNNLNEKERNFFINLNKTKTYNFYEFKDIKKTNIVLKNIIKDFTSIFLKIILKNKSFKFNFWLRSQKRNIHLKQASYPATKLSFSSRQDSKIDNLKINKFKEIKNYLIKYYLLSNVDFLYQKIINYFFLPVSKANKKTSKLVSAAGRHLLPGLLPPQQPEGQSSQGLYSQILFFLKDLLILKKKINQNKKLTEIGERIINLFLLTGSKSNILNYSLIRSISNPTACFLIKQPVTIQPGITFFKNFLKLNKSKFLKDKLKINLTIKKIEFSSDASFSFKASAVKQYLRLKKKRQRQSSERRKKCFNKN